MFTMFSMFIRVCDCAAVVVVTSAEIYGSPESIAVKRYLEANQATGSYVEAHTHSAAASADVLAGLPDLAALKHHDAQAGADPSHQFVSSVSCWLACVFYGHVALPVSSPSLYEPVKWVNRCTVSAAVCRRPRRA